LTLTNRQKHATLLYTGLVSRDGNGKELRTWLELQGERVLLKVEDAGARYPLVIDPWVQLAELTASDGVTSQSFGLAVAINDDTVVVGENCNEIVFGACNLTRAVYVFVKPTSGWANMTEVAKLTASDGIVADQFGTSVAVDGDTVVVGAPGHNNFAGAVYVFVKPTGGWANMTEVAKLTASDGKAGDFFGASVAVSGNDRAIVIGGVNAAYVFLKPERGWNTTSNFNAKMTGSDAAPNNLFGISVAISGKTVVVGAPFFHGATGPGAAYVFVRPAGGWTTMTETAKLTPSDGTTFDEFGLSTAVSGKTIVVGSPQEPGSNGEQGVAYVFEEPPGGWTNMTQTARLIASDGSTGGHIGSSVAVSGNTAVVGAFLQNEAYVFVKPKGGWTDMTETAKLMPGQGAFFGFSVSISRTTIAVGDPFFNSFEGTAYVFGPVK
jgi:hypothetical protein